MMTRKHFRKIADILQSEKVLYTGWDETQFQILVSRFANFLANENPRFDKIKFIEACCK